MHIFACIHIDMHLYMHINIFISQCPVSSSIPASAGRAHLAIVENLAIYFSKEPKYEGLILLSLNFKYKWQSKMQDDTALLHNLYMVLSAYKHAKKLKKVTLDGFILKCTQLQQSIFL